VNLHEKRTRNEKEPASGKLSTSCRKIFVTRKADAVPLGGFDANNEVGPPCAGPNLVVLLMRLCNAPIAV
jgi:hypothetical protein